VQFGSQVLTCSRIFGFERHGKDLNTAAAVWLYLPFFLALLYLTMIRQMAVTSYLICDFF